MTIVMVKDGIPRTIKTPEGNVSIAVSAKNQVGSNDGTVSIETSQDGVNYGSINEDVYNKIVSDLPGGKYYRLRSSNGDYTWFDGTLQIQDN